MSTVSNFLSNTRRRLTFDSNEVYINTDKFNAHSRLDDIWNSTHQEMCEIFQLPAFHLWGDGFVQGDASQEELLEAVNAINSIENEKGSGIIIEYNEIDEDFTVSDIFVFLDFELLKMLEPQVNSLIEEFDNWIKEQQS